MTLRSFPLAVCLLALTVNVFTQDGSPDPRAPAATTGSTSTGRSLTTIVRRRIISPVQTR
jgi:hypothetical protein